MKTETTDIIFKRRSCRAFQAKKLDAETVDLLAKAALAAPSAMNAQPVNVTVVKNAALIEEWEKAVVNYFVKIGNKDVVERNKGRNNKIFYGAPVVFLLTVKNNSSTDVGIMAENIVLAAESLGLGTIHLGLPGVVFADADTAAYWRGKLKTADGYEYGLAVAAGYAEGPGKQPHEIDVQKLSYIE